VRQELFSSRLLSIRRSALILIVAAAATSQRAAAADFPLTPKAASTAIKAGTASAVTSLVTDDRYEATADKETWPGFTPSCRATTPYLRLAFAAAQARAKYQPAPMGLATAAQKDSTLGVSTELFSTELEINNDAVGVIKQRGLLIRAKRREYLSNDVVEAPAVGYQRLVQFEFDMRRFQVNQPFTVTIANVFTEAGIGEFSCRFDGRNFPEGVPGQANLARTDISCARPNAAATTVHAVEPDTPPLAQQQGISGDVAVIVSLNAKSQVVGTKIQSSPSALLNETALQAARQSTYRTEIQNCKPIPSSYVTTVTFSSQ
jgi:TonB family protein